MRKTGIFHINGEQKELPLFQKGDRVKAVNTGTLVDVTGTVESTEGDGLFVNVNWDRTEYPKKSGQVHFGSTWSVDNLVFLDEE